MTVYKQDTDLCVINNMDFPDCANFYAYNEDTEEIICMDECGDGYFSIENWCEECPEGCATCVYDESDEEATLNCGDCQDGYDPLSWGGYEMCVE